MRSFQTKRCFKEFSVLISFPIQATGRTYLVALHQPCLLHLAIKNKRCLKTGVSVQLNQRLGYFVNASEKEVTVIGGSKSMVQSKCRHRYCNHRNESECDETISLMFKDTNHAQRFIKLTLLSDYAKKKKNLFQQIKRCKPAQAYYSMRAVRWSMAWLEREGSHLPFCLSSASIQMGLFSFVTLPYSIS